MEGTLSRGDSSTRPNALRCCPTPRISCFAVPSALGVYSGVGSLSTLSYAAHCERHAKLPQPFTERSEYIRTTLALGEVLLG